MILIAQRTSTPASQRPKWDRYLVWTGPADSYEAASMRFSRCATGRAGARRALDIRNFHNKKRRDRCMAPELCPYRSGDRDLDRRARSGSAGETKSLYCGFRHNYRSCFLSCIRLNLIYKTN